MAPWKAGDLAGAVGESTSFLELMQYLIELAHAESFGEVRISIQRGQIGTIRFEQVFKPGELPIKDRGRLEHLRAATQK